MKRRNSLNITDSELKEYLQVIISSFSKDWLENESGHPIQKLWKRNDELATNELFSLACAIKDLSKIDAKWTNAQIKIVKSKDKNNSRGAIFEILALNILNAVEHPVKPAKLNQAGYDGVITKAGSQEMRVSIKSYGSSNTQQHFESKSKVIEQLILKLLKKYKYPPSQILLDFPDKFPNERDWKLLEENIDGMFKEQRHKSEPFSAFVEPIDSKKAISKDNARTIFVLIVAPIKNKKDYFHESFNSYTLMISAAYHENEHLNLFSKMDDACANLTKHSAIENENIVNSLFLHLPETVSFSQCTEWLDKYFELFPNKQISVVILYQPVVAMDIANNKSGITNCIKIYIRKNRKINGNYTFSIPVGMISSESTNLIFVAEFPDGKKESIPLENRYSYQHGEHFTKMKPDGKGGFQGNIQKVGNGVHTTVVLEMPGQTKKALIKGKFPPYDELLIL